MLGKILKFRLASCTDRAYLLQCKNSQKINGEFLLLNFNFALRAGVATSRRRESSFRKCREIAILCRCSHEPRNKGGFDYTGFGKRISGTVK
jgi:hypothetical protein